MQYGPKIVRSGLVLHLDAADRKSYSGSGTSWNDLSGNNNRGTLAPVGSPPTFSSSNGGVIVFIAGNEHRCPISNLVNLNNTSATHEIWVRLNNPNSGTSQQIFARTNTSTETFNISKSALNQLNVSYRNAANTQNIVILNTTPSTNWVHIMITYNTSILSAYINGVLDTTSSTVTGALNTGGTFGMTLASIGGPAQSCDCNIGLARAYNRALSASEVLQNFNATRGRFGI